MGSAHTNSDLRTHCHAVTQTRRFPTFRRSRKAGAVQKGPQRTNRRAYGPAKGGEVDWREPSRWPYLLHHAGTDTGAPGPRGVQDPIPTSHGKPPSAPRPAPPVGPAAGYGCWNTLWAPSGRAARPTVPLQSAASCRWLAFSQPGADWLTRTLHAGSLRARQPGAGVHGAELQLLATKARRSRALRQGWPFWAAVSLGRNALR